MKIDIEENQNIPVYEYPRLMRNKSNEAIVLFIDEEQGLCLRSGHVVKEGTFDRYLDIEKFELFEGTITLSN